MIRRSTVMAVLALVPTLMWAEAPSGPVEAAADLDVPRRVLDTREGIGSDVGRLLPGETLRVLIPGLTIDGETVALLNLTTSAASAPGFVSAWSCDDPAPATSVLNYFPGRAIPNAVALRYTASGLCFSASAPVHLLADLTGVTTNGDVRGVEPQRIYDSRSGNRLAAGKEYRIDVAGTPGIPNRARAAALNVTVVRPAAAGYVLVQPCGGNSNASTVNYFAGDVVPHFTFTGLGSGAICVTASAATDLIIDTFGWMGSGSSLQAFTPDRLLDTRSGLGGTHGAVRNGQLVRLRAAGVSGVPNDAAGATVNVVAVRASAFGYVNVWPCDSAEPETSVLNLWPGIIRSNQATIKLSASGELCLRPLIVGSSGVDLVVDAVGYVDGDVDRDPPAPPPPPPPPSGDFETLPVGATLPSGAECASRVRPAGEVRPENASANNNRGSRANANNRTDWAAFDRVDGDFTGTTDEIIQWAACKWGIDEDVARAQVVKESFWYQSANGDGGESWGLGQVRDTAHQSAFEYSVNARNSSAYNLDYTYAVWRACFEGVYTWLNTVERGATYGPGDMWGCTGVWFSGRWYTDAAVRYIEGGDTGEYGDIGVKQHLSDRTWESSGFING
jgi:autotransporter family porin